MKKKYNRPEDFNLFPDLIKASNNFNKASSNFNLTCLLVSRWRRYYGTFPAEYNITLGPLNLPKDNYLGHFSNDLKNARANYLAPKGLDGYFVKGRIFNLSGRRDG